MINFLKNIFIPNKRDKILKAINKSINDRKNIEQNILEKCSIFSVLIQTCEDIDIIKSYEENYFNEIFNLKRKKRDINQNINDLSILFYDNIIKSEENNNQRLRYKDKLLESSLGYKRENMPQLDSSNIGDFIIHFGDKVGIKKVKKNISKLKPSQGEINENKVYDSIGKNFLEDDDSIRYIISNDNYILDGHHRWAGELEINPNKKVICYQVNLPIKELISRSNKLKISNKKDINDNDIEKADIIMNYETLEENNISNFYKKLIIEDYRPFGIDNNSFLKSINCILDTKDKNIINKAKSIVSKKIPVRRFVRRKDGTTFAQIFWISPEENKQIDKRPLTDTQSQKSKDLFEKQKIAEKVVKIGDKVNVRFVGPVFGGNYSFDNWEVISVDKDKVIVKIPENIHTKSPDGKPVSFRKNGRIEIPKTNNPLWSEFQGFEIDLPKEDFLSRKNKLKIINRDTLLDAKKEGYDIFPELILLPKEEVEEKLKDFNKRWGGFNPLEMFRDLKNDLKPFFDNDEFDTKFIFDYNKSFMEKNTGNFQFDVIVNYKDSGEEALIMRRLVDEFGSGKGIYHKLLNIDQAFLNKGIAKKMFKSLYKQYKNSDVNYLAVDANINVGGYTWGSMGFSCNIEQAENLLSRFKSGIGETIVLKEHFLDINSNVDFNERVDDPYYNYKKEKFLKEIEEKQDEIKDLEKKSNVISKESLLISLKNKISSLEREIDSMPKTKRYLKVNGKILDILKSEHYTLTDDDYNNAKNIFETWKKNNPNKNRFPVNLFCSINNKKAGKVALLGSRWQGTINLKEQSERDYFEKYLGIKND